MAWNRPNFSLSFVTWRPWSARAYLLLHTLATLVVLCFFGAVAQAEAIDAPLGQPVVTADAKLFGKRVNQWKVEGVQFALLDGDVTIDIGAYAFRADRASLRIDTQNAGGKLIRHLSLYLENARTREGGGPIAASGTKLFVTVSTTGKLDLAADAWKDEAAAGDPLVSEAQARYARYISAMRQPTGDLPADLAKRLQIGPTGRPVAPPPPQVPTPRIAEGPDGQAKADDIPNPLRIAPQDGTVAFNADKFVFERGDNGESYVSLIGNVKVIFQDEEGNSALSLRAENALIFLGNVGMEAIAGNRAKSLDVRGVYLEDNVIATNGDYTLRAPRIYYDLKQNKAVVLHAVFYAWDVKKRVPLYVRADRLRQESSKSWSADQAVLTTSEFAEPHIAIASDRITFRQQERSDGTTANIFRSQNTRIEVGGLPILGVSDLSGEGQDIPLRRFQAGYNSGSGPDIRTQWDVFAILGREPLDGVDLTGNLDLRGDHGFAIGLNLDYERPDMFGYFDSYLVIHDSGTDDLTGDRNVEQDEEIRGYVNGFHRHFLRDNWELSLQVGYVSDPTFLEEFFSSQAEAAKPYETSIYLKKQQEETAFTFLAQYDVNNFTPQLTTLQAPGYGVDKSPEIAWRQLGTALFGNRLTYFGDSRLSYMRPRVGQDSPADRGFNDAQSLLNFGIASADTEFRDALASTGFPTDHRLRFDSRHEIQAPIKLSIFNVTPYASGRITAYDEDFEEFSGEDEQVRFFGTLGTRIHTEFSRTYDDIDVQLLDVHRVRHILEPGIDLSYAGSTINPEDLPVYDADVEMLSEGYTIRLGLRNTLQTQRGGEGRWRSVDWLTLDTDLVLRGNDADVDSPLPRYFSYRPELSLGGDHFYTRLIWAVSDSLGAVAEMTYGFEDNEVAQWRIGADFQQTPHLRWHMDYAEIDELDSRLLGWGLSYQLTTHYMLTFRHVMDFAEDEARTVELMLTRQLSRWRLALVFDYDELDSEYTVGIVVLPDGARSSRLDSAWRGFGR